MCVSFCPALWTRVSLLIILLSVAMATQQVPMRRPRVNPAPTPDNSFVDEESSPLRDFLNEAERTLEHFGLASATVDVRSVSSTIELSPRKSDPCDPMEWSSTAVFREKNT